MFDLKYCAETVFKVINAWFTDGAEHYVSHPSTFVRVLCPLNGVLTWCVACDRSA